MGLFKKRGKGKSFPRFFAPPAGKKYNIHMESYLKVKVHAGEKKNRLEQKGPDSYEIWVKAPAEQGRANEAVRALLAQHLNVAENKLSLIKGATSPAKIFLKRS